jgi:hypothetical protein
VSLRRFQNSNLFKTNNFREHGVEDDHERYREIEIGEQKINPGLIHAAIVNRKTAHALLSMKIAALRKIGLTNRPTFGTVLVTFF